jgi:hypothetical protein
MEPRSATVAYFLTADINFIGKILKTADGGITWTELYVSSENLFLSNIHFFNSNDGVVTAFPSDNHGKFMIFTTSDSGNNWVRVPDENLPHLNGAEAPYNYSMSAVGDTIWTVSTKARVWKSTDKGHHWNKYSTGDNEAVVSNIKMRDGMHGLWGLNDELYRTSDGGETWEEIEPVGTWFTNDLAYVPGIGSSYTIDEGTTWITLDTGVDQLALDMVNAYTGFAGGFNTNNSNGMFTYAGPALGYSCGNNRTYICHQGNTICVTRNNIATHLSHGDYLGACSPNRTGALTSNVISDIRVNVFPNPVSNSTTISFSLPQLQNVSLKVFDVSGRLVATIADQLFDEGENEITWNASDIITGIYFLRMDSGNYSATKKITCIK